MDLENGNIQKIVSKEYSLAFSRNWLVRTERAGHLAQSMEGIKNPLFECDKSQAVVLLGGRLLYLIKSDQVIEMTEELQRPTI